MAIAGLKKGYVLRVEQSPTPLRLKPFHARDEGALTERRGRKNMNEQDVWDEQRWHDISDLDVFLIVWEVALDELKHIPMPHREISCAKDLAVVIRESVVASMRIEKLHCRDHSRFTGST